MKLKIQAINATIYYFLIICLDNCINLIKSPKSFVTLTTSVLFYIPSLPADIAADTEANLTTFISFIPSHTYIIFPYYF